MEQITQEIGVRGALKYESSPFYDSLVVNTRNRRLTVARGGAIIDSHTGEIEGVTEISQIVDVDEGQFVKLFTKDLAIWFDLTRPAMRVFGALLATVQVGSIGRDLVFFEQGGKIPQEFGLSKQTFYYGLKQLIALGFIARHRSAGWYFINPAMFFNGNRARFVKEYRVSRPSLLCLKSSEGDIGGDEEASDAA